MTQRTPLDDKDATFVAAWDQEIEREFAEELRLRRQAAQDDQTIRETAYLEQAPVRAALLPLAGTSEAAIQERAGQELARVREAAAAQRTTASEIVRSRTTADRAETGKLVAGVRRA
jgi:hypothetical protein